MGSQPPPPVRRNPPRRGRPTPAPAPALRASPAAAAASPAAAAAAAASRAAAAAASRAAAAISALPPALDPPKAAASSTSSSCPAAAAASPAAAAISALPPALDPPKAAASSTSSSCPDLNPRGKVARNCLKLDELRLFVNELKENPALLYDPALKFFLEYVKPSGAAASAKPSGKRMGTGIKGIRQEASGHYSAHLKVGKRQEHLGTFKSIEEAVDVWQKADQKRGLMIKKRQNFKTSRRRIILRKIPIQEEEAEANKEQDAKPFDTQDIVHYHDTEAEDRSATTESLCEESSSLLQRFKEEELLSTISDLQKELRSRDDAAAARKQSYDAELCEKNLVIKEQHNLIQNLTGQIRVFCRVRPLTEVETAAGFKCVVDLDGSNKGDIGIMDAGGTKKTFKFDKVYTPNDEQGTVYADVSPLVTTVMDGFNVCIFAYGPTGSGKTFTMEGTERNRGVNYRTLEELFKIAEERINNFDYKLSVIMLEIYNDDIRDLLATSPPSEKLEIRETDEGTHYVNGVEEVPIKDIKQVWHLLQKGSKSRAKGSNNVNVHSSRSHCALSVVVRGKNLINGDITRSVLWLVDLAGSERLPKTGTEGERLKEAICINRSLSALGEVISAIVDRKSHIPYRNSKLTQLLQDSLGGGDSKTTMILHVSPSDNDVLETSCSLKFGSRVRSVKLGPAKKHFQGVEVRHKVKTVRPTATASRVRQQSNKNPFSGPESCRTWSARP